MEILLNLVWAALALSMVCLWLRTGNSRGADRSRQVIAIAVLVAILFPVISVSDDLLAMQTAAEQDTLQRRDHLAPSSTHPILPFAAILTAVAFRLSFGSPRFLAAFALPLPSIGHPELGVTGDRAPPAA